MRTRKKCPLPIAKKEISMSTAASEQRIQALEAAVADLRSQPSAREADRTCATHGDLTPDVEQPLVPAVPPKQLQRLRARVTCVHEGPRDFGLSHTEWAALNLQKSDE